MKINMNKIKRQIFSVLLVGLMPLFVNATEYYVSKTGDDANPGTSAEPFFTVGKAASIAVAGDVVNIMEGIYRETVTPANSGYAGKPIVFQSVPGEKVIISAMEPVSGFTSDAGSIYKATLDWDLGQRMFVVHNNETVLDLARWPNNTDGDRFSIDAKWNSGGSDRSSTSEGYLLYDEIPQLPWENGGTLFFFGDSRWYGWKFPVTAVSPGRIDWKSTHPSGSEWVVAAHAPSRLGEFFLEGIKEALDYQNEWYFNSSTKELFLQLPEGVAPEDGSIEVSKRENTIYLQNKNYIEIKNLAVYGGSVIMNGDNNTLYGVSSFYGGMTRGSDARGLFTYVAAVKVGWKGGGGYYKNNVIENCEVAYCDASAINVVGENTTIKNNYIHDADYLGTYDSPIVARDGKTTYIENNTITKGGRDCIKIINKGSEISYNDVSYSNLIADDCGLLYIIGGNLNIDVHHNWFHDAYGRGDLYKAAGIYLDSSNDKEPNPEKVNVYKNVVWNTEWTSIQVNWNGTDINIFNNTFLGGSSAMGAWHMAGTKFVNVNVWNNFYNTGSLDDQADLQNNFEWPGTADLALNDIENYDFTLRDNSIAIDKGREIEGYTDGFVGSAPDVGAYEYGGEKWVAGIDWDIYSGPNGLCYGLPGEACSSNTVDVQEKQQDKFAESAFAIYPNPVNDGTLFIEFNDFSKENSEYSIYSISGALMQSGILESGHANTVINIEEIPTGYYMVHITNDKKESASRFIKM